MGPFIRTLPDTDIAPCNGTGINKYGESRARLDNTSWNLQSEETAVE